MAIAVLLLVYGAIIVVGGGIGYFKAKSKPSLIAGAICGAALIASGAVILAGMNWGAWLGFALTLLLIVIFGRRYAKAQVAMPTGMMLGMSVVVAAALFTELFE